VKATAFSRTRTDIGPRGTDAEFVARDQRGPSPSSRRRTPTRQRSLRNRGALRTRLDDEAAPSSEKAGDGTA
jgi:hypothetical protein